MNIFACAGYQFSFTPAFIESVRQTEKLVIVSDQLPDSLYFSWIKAQLWEHKLSHIKVKLLTPQYEKITSISPEYFWEQAGIDAFGIANMC